MDHYSGAGCRLLLNPLREPSSIVLAREWRPLDLHRRLPGYKPTPLIDASAVARRLGVRRVLVKDESQRLGLPAYKILGASWAIFRSLQRRVGSAITWTTLDHWRAQVDHLRPLTLVAATDGNHGRAVARVARWLGFGAVIIVPDDMVPARRAAIVSEGAELVVVEGTYDDAVKHAASLASDRFMVISDTGWDGYEDVPRWVMEGYSTIFEEVDFELFARDVGEPDVVFVQIGVGALAAATVAHYASKKTTIIGVEPTTAACVLESLAAQRLVEVPGPHASSMAGLNCGNASPVAWPLVSAGLSASLAVDDVWAARAMKLLHDDGIISGESGAAGLAGALALVEGGVEPPRLADLQLHANSTVLFISTEGNTGGAARNVEI